MVRMETPEHKSDREELQKIISTHVANTGSEKGKMILEHFDSFLPHFKKIIPSDYKEMLRLIAKCEEHGADPKEARIEAFREFIGEGTARQE